MIVDCCVVCFVFYWCFFFWFSGIGRGEVHPQNWDPNGLVGNEMDTKCHIRFFHMRPKTQCSLRSFLINKYLYIYIYCYHVYMYDAFIYVYIYVHVNLRCIMYGVYIYIYICTCKYIVHVLK